MLREIPTVADLLPPAARTFYEALPDPVPVWRGCDRGERGVHWTTWRAVAEGFATGKRCLNAHPILASAEIPKRENNGQRPAASAECYGLTVRGTVFVRAKIPFALVAYLFSRRGYRTPPSR